MGMASEVLEESQSHKSQSTSSQHQQQQQTGSQQQQQQNPASQQQQHPLQPHSGSVSSASNGDAHGGGGDGPEAQPSPCPGEVIEIEHASSPMPGHEGGPLGGDSVSDKNRINLSTNGQNGDKTQNGANHSKTKCLCWCCCCNCSSLKSYNMCRSGSARSGSGGTGGQGGGGGTGRSASRRRTQSSNNRGDIPLGPLELNSSNGGGEGKDHECGPDPFHTDAPLPTLEAIRGWSDSFDSLMSSPWGRKVFADFLRREFSEENILFWLACEQLKHEQDDSRVEECARNIYEDYVSILSPREVSLDSRVREIINKNMVEPCRTTFEEAQVQIYTLMQRDSYPRFVNSPQYRKLAGLPTPSRKGSAA